MVNKENETNKSQEYVSFLYLSGSTQRDSIFRQTDGLKLVSEKLTNGFSDKKAGNTDSFETLLQIAEEAGLNISPTFYKRIANEKTILSDDGAEHTVYGDKRSGRVVKVTHADEVGDGTLQGKGSARDYFVTLLLSKAVLGIDTRFEGLVNLGESFPRIVTSQPWIQGKKAKEDEIAIDLEKRGFSRVEKDSNIWKHDKIGITIYDAIPDNVYKDKTGKLHYFDVDAIPNKPLLEVLKNIKTHFQDSQNNQNSLEKETLLLGNLQIYKPIKTDTVPRKTNKKGGIT